MNSYEDKIGKYCEKYNIFFINDKYYNSKYKNKKINWPYLSRFLSKKYNNYILKNLDKIVMQILIENNKILKSTFDEWCKSKYSERIFIEHNFIIDDNDLEKTLEYCINKKILEKKDVFNYFSLSQEFIEKNIDEKIILNDFSNKKIDFLSFSIKNLNNEFILDKIKTIDQNCTFLKYKKFDEKFILKLLEKDNEISFYNCAKNIFTYQYLTPKIFEKIFDENINDLYKCQFNSPSFIFTLSFRQKLSKNMIINICKKYKNSKIKDEIITCIVITQYKYYKNFNFMKNYINWNFILTLENLSTYFKEKYINQLSQKND